MQIFSNHNFYDNIMQTRLDILPRSFETCDQILGIAQHADDEYVALVFSNQVIEDISGQAWYCALLKTDAPGLWILPLHSSRCLLRTRLLCLGWKIPAGAEGREIYLFQKL